MKIYIIIHILCMIYCIWRLTRRYKKSSLDGVTGYTPGLDLIMVAILAPILFIADIVVTIIGWFKAKRPLTCDYCKKEIQVWYEAYLFPVKEYKGPVICEDCVRKGDTMELGSNEKIIFV